MAKLELSTIIKMSTNYVAVKLRYHQLTLINKAGHRTRYSRLVEGFLFSNFNFLSNFDSYKDLDLCKNLDK